MKKERRKERKLIGWKNNCEKDSQRDLILKNNNEKVYHFNW